MEPHESVQHQPRPHAQRHEVRRRAWNWVGLVGLALLAAGVAVLVFFALNVA